MREVLPELFERYPTPKKMMVANFDDLFDILQPLGFGMSRSERLILMSTAASQRRVVGTWPGIGRYAMDSWMIFVCGTFMPADDKELRSYQTWLQFKDLEPPSYIDENERIITPKPLKIMRLRAKDVR